MLETLFITGGFMAETAGGSFIPHVLTVQIGEVMKDLKDWFMFQISLSFIKLFYNCAIN